MAIKNTALATGAATSIYTSTGNSAITTIHLCNFSNAIQTVNVHIVQSGFAANSTNMIYSNLQLPALNTWVVSSEKFILSNGDFVAANCGNSGAASATVSSIGI